MSEVFTSQLSIEAVVVLAAALIAVVIINLIPSTSDPFGLLFVMIHELGHVVSAQVTGGEVDDFSVFSPKSGVTNFTTIGNDYIVTPAGYLGTALFSAALILATGWPYLARYVLSFLGFLLIIAVVRYANRKSRLTMLVGLGFGLAFIWIGWQAALVWVVFFLYVLALQGAWTTLFSLFELAQEISQKRQSERDDATIFARLLHLRFGCASGCVVILWFLVTVVLLGTSFWFIWLRPLF